MSSWLHPRVLFKHRTINRLQWGIVLRCVRITNINVPVSVLAGLILTALLVGCASQKVLTPPPPVPVDTTFARSEPVVAPNGMVVCAHPFAAESGVNVLKSGGNAIDAAIAVLAALNVVEPHASGLGGGGFLLYYDAASDSLSVIDYRERAPARLQRARYFDPADTLRLVQRSGGSSVLTPGAAAGWQTMHSRFGTLPLTTLFESAISVADSGYAISDKRAAIILEHHAELLADSGLAGVFLQESLPPAAGFVIKQPKLAELLRFLSRTRLENFYYPPVSTAVAKSVQAHGGTLSAADLRNYQVKDRTPLRGEYHGYEIITLPAPGGGATLLEILELLDPIDLKIMGYQSPDYIHTVASACRQAMGDADAWIADPDHFKVPVDAMLSPAWLDSARLRMKADSAADKITIMDSLRAFGPGNTTHLVIVDSSGNLVSLTQSINYFFGSGVFVPEWGLLLNNHMADFAGDTTSRRGIAPLRRPPSNMAATIVRKNGRPVIVIGSPGGPRIAPTLAQVLIALLDFGLPLADAQNAPRFYPARKTLVVETRIPEVTLQALAARGWKIYPYGHLNSFFGGVQAIRVDSLTGELTGAADPRRDGAAVGY